MATSLNNLGVVYYQQGKYTKAEPLYQRALAIWEKTLGPNHPNVAAACKNMMKLYRKMGRKREAKEFEERLKRIRSKR